MTLGLEFDDLAPRKCEKCGATDRPYKTINSESHAMPKGVMVTWKCKSCEHILKQLIQRPHIPKTQEKG